MMTRKDYRAIAAAIHMAYDAHKDRPSDLNVIYGVAFRVADTLTANSGYDTNGNRLFDRERFLEACGVSR